MAHIIVKKLRNNLLVRLPAAIMQKASLNIDDTVEISVENGRIIITPINTQEYSLEMLLADITPDNVHEKVNFGEPIGKELI